LGTSSEAAKKRWEDPEYAAKMKEKIRAATKKRWEDPEYRAKMKKMAKDRAKQTSEEQKERWKDKAYRKNQVDKIRSNSEKYSEKAKKQWEDPEFREKMKEVQKKNNANPNRKTRKGQKNSEEAKTKQAERARERWKDKDYRKKNEERLRKQAADPKNTEVRLEATRKKFATDPEFKERFHKGTSRCSTETNLANWQNPECVEKMKENAKKLWEDPKHVEKMKENAKKLWEDPEYRKKGLETLKRGNETYVRNYWNKTPEEREKIISDRMKKVCTFPNGLERKVIDFGIENLIYTGDGSMFIRHPDGKSKNPDFYVKGSDGKKWVELWGNYWHKGEDPEEAKCYFSKAGCEVLIFWEKEVNKEPLKVKQLIEAFIND